jgi:hypothetical protein
MSKNKPTTIWKKYGVFETGKPASVWNRTGVFEGKKPASIWRETSGNYEYQNVGIRYIVDTIGNFLVDTLGNNITDTGVEMTIYPASVWKEDDSV